MELGPILALLAAAVFGAMAVLIRRGMHQSEESFTAAAINVFVGTPLFLFILPVATDWARFWAIPWHVFVILGIAGITQFVLGSYFIFSSIRLIGANKSLAVVRMSGLFAAIFGITFLSESCTVLLVSGILCIIAGAVLVSFEREEEVFGLKAKGVILALGGSLCVGVSSVLVKSVMEDVDSPYTATFISYLAAFLLWITLLTRKEQRDQLLQLSRSSLIVLLIAGVLGLVGTLLRYIAFSYSPVSVVQPLVGTVVLFAFFFSFLVNRKIDVFNRRVFTGIILVVAGTFMLFL